MVNSSKEPSRKIDRYFHTGLAVVVGAVISLDVMIRLPYIFNIQGFWRYSWILLLIIYVTGALIAAWVVDKPIRIFMEQIKTKDGLKIYVFLLLLYYLFLVMLYLLRLPNPLTPLSSSLVQGKRGILLKASDIFIHLVVIPGILYDLVSLNAKIKTRLLRFFESKSILIYYNQLFVSILVAAGLAAFFLSPTIDIRNSSNKIWGSNWLMDVFAGFRYHIGDHLFGLAFAEKDWFIYLGENSLDDFQNTIPFTPRDLAEIQGKLDQLSAFLNSKDIKLIVIIPPNKNTIYPEFMPPQIPVIGDQSRLDQLVEYEKEHGQFKITDVKPDLLQASRQYQTYFSCGTHWNALGAFIAYQDIFRFLEIDFPNLKPHDLNEYRMVNFQGDTDLVSISHLDSSACQGVYLKPLFDRQVTTQLWNIAGEIPTNFYSNGISNITTINVDPSLPRLLMYRDSFSSYLVPLLSDHFSRAIYLWAYPTDDVYSYIEAEKPDVVIIEITERSLDFLRKLPD
jgi:hypothetical protein